MSKKYDAVVIGAGIIGCCVAFELAKKGYSTLNVDKLPESGHGSTANSCAVIRLHYSTPDGVALARESYFYWLNWENYLETTDNRGMIKYISTGCLVTRTDRNKYLKYVTKSLDELNVDYEELDAAGIKRKFPCIDTRKYGPPKLPGDQNFGKVTGDAIEGAVYIYDKSDLPGFYMAVGTSGNQYKNAPVVGAMMAYLIGKVEAGHNHDKDPVLYPLKYIKRSLNIGSFSRLREINKDSSFSVIG